MSPPQITKLFKRRNEHPYNLRQNVEFLQPFLNFVHCETKSISYSLYNFKKVLKKWKPENCQCRVCKTFVKNLGFCEIAWIIMFVRPVVSLIFSILYFKIQNSKVFLFGGWRELAWVSLLKRSYFYWYTVLYLFLGVNL